MTTVGWIILDYAVALLSVIAWFAAGIGMSLRRNRITLALLIVALLLTFARVASVVALAGRGWWFAQEKVLFGLPMLGVAALAAAAIAGPRLFARATGARSIDTAGVVALFTAAYAALAGFVVTFLVGYPLTLGTALITIALVCAGTLLTASARGTEYERGHRFRTTWGFAPPFSRRCRWCGGSRRGRYRRRPVRAARCVGDGWRWSRSGVACGRIGHRSAGTEHTGTGWRAA